jgi:hypothetical protein
MAPLSDIAARRQDGSMKLALFAIAVLATCANELVLSVRKEQDAMKARAITPETWRETLAQVLEPVLTVAYIIIFPLAIVALLWALCVFAPIQAFVLVLMLLIPAAGWLLRR